MTDAALQNAMARRAATADKLTDIVTQINNLIEVHTRLKTELDEIDDFIRMWHVMAGTQPPKELEQKVADAPAEGGKRIRPRNPDRRDVARAAVNYIREAGRPLMRKDLMERLAKDGVEIRGTDPLMVLSTMLWRSKDVIKRLKGGGYWPVGDPLPPGQASDLEDLIG